MKNRAVYMNETARAIIKILRKADRENLIPCIRLNGSTDISWERIRFKIDAKTSKALAVYYGEIESVDIDETYYESREFTLLSLFPIVQFVDYTKNPKRLYSKPSNLDLTLSYSARNSADCVKALLDGHNVAMVFHGGLPDWFAGFPVIDGDKHDLRHLDAKGGFIVGLSPKGNKAKKDKSGFVVDWRNDSGRKIENLWIGLRHQYNARLAA